MNHKKKHTDVIERLATLKGALFWNLFFDPPLEQQYLHTQQNWYRDTVRASSLLAVLLILASQLVDWVYAIELPLFVLLWRAAVVIGLLGTYLYALRSSGGRWLLWLASVNSLMIVASFLLIARYSAEPIKQIYYTNIFFVEIVLFAFIRPPLNFASTTALLMVLMVGLGLYQDVMSARVFSYLLFLLIAGTLMCLMVAVRMEKFSRRAFLQHELIQMERKRLQELDARMGEHVSQDPVTRLQNRLTFEDALLHASESPVINGPRLVLLALQVEHFSRYNDQEGQDKGDDLLRHVARLLRTLFHDLEGCAARIGGGRFVLLCHVHHEHHLHAALENLRQKLLALPPLQQDPPQRHIALSWGSVQVQRDPERDPRMLIDRIFRHLIPLEAPPFSASQTVARNPGFGQ